MKAILSMLVGIATLFGGVIGSIATADDHKYLYVTSGIGRPPVGRSNIRIMNPSPTQTATVDIQVFDEYGWNVGSDRTITLGPRRLVRVVRTDEEMRGSLGTSLRSVFITSTEELWVFAQKGAAGPGRMTLPVYSQVVPTTPTTPTTPPGGGGDEKDTDDKT